MIWLAGSSLERTAAARSTTWSPSWSARVDADEHREAEGGDRLELSGIWIVGIDGHLGEVEIAFAQRAPDLTGGRQQSFGAFTCTEQSPAARRRAADPDVDGVESDFGASSRRASRTDHRPDASPRVPTS